MSESTGDLLLVHRSGQILLDALSGTVYSMDGDGTFVARPTGIGLPAVSEFFAAASRSEAQGWHERVEALDLAMIAMDPLMTDGIGAEAAEELEILMEASPEVEEWLKNLLLSYPVPAGLDPSLLLEFGPSVGRIRQLGVVLVDMAEPVRAIADAWDAAEEEFADPEEGLWLRSVLAQDGVLKRTAEKFADGVESVEYDLLSNSHVRKTKNHRNFVVSFARELTGGVRPSAADFNASDRVPSRPQEAPPYRDVRSSVRSQVPRGATAREKLDRVERQKRGILEALAGSRPALADHYLAALIDLQADEWDRSLLPRSLSDLGRQALSMGANSFAKTCVTTACELVPWDFVAMLGLTELVRARGIEPIDALTFLEKIDPDETVAACLYGRSFAWYEMERCDIALEYAERSCVLQPDGPACWTQAAMCLRVLSRPEDALVASRRAEQLMRLADSERSDRSLATTGVTVASLLEELGRVKDARNHLVELIDMVPAEPLPRLSLVDLAVRQPRIAGLSLEEAQRLLDGFEGEPMSYAVLVRAAAGAGRLDVAERLAGEGGARFPTDSNVALAWSDALVATGRELDSLAALERFFQQAPDSPALRVRYAERLRDSGRRSAAVRWLEEASQLFPGDRYIGTAYGDALRSVGELDDAVAAYRRILTLHPQHIYALVGLGKSLKNLGEFSESKRVLKEAMVYSAGMGPAAMEYASCLSASGEHELAIAEFRRLARLAPRNEYLVSGLCEAFRFAGRLDEALSEYLHALAKFPENSVLLNGYGQVLKELGRFDEAIQEFAKSLVMNPDDPATLNSIAEAYKASGNYTAASNYYLRRLDGVSHDVFALCGLAGVRKRQGRLGQAVEYYKRALEFEPANPFARNGLSSCLLLTGEVHAALQLASRESHRTVGDWIALHIEAMCHRKLGDDERSLACLAFGAAHAPMVCVAPFNTGLAIMSLQNGEAQKALSLIDFGHRPANDNDPASSILRFHARGELQLLSSSDQAQLEEVGRLAPFAGGVVEELKRRYSGMPGRRRTNRWLFDHEFSVLAIAA